MTTDNFCFYLSNRLFQTSQTGGQLYSETSPFSIPWANTLAYYDTATITAVKSFIVQAPGVAGDTNPKGRFSTLDVLVKVACFFKR
jgi:hypothetical protein